MMRIAKCLCALVLVAGMPLGLSAEPLLEGTEEDIAAINAVFERWGAARDAGNIDGILAVHHPDMIIMTRDKAAYVGHPGVREFYSTHYHENAERQLLGSVSEIRVFAEVAFVIGRFLALDPKNEIEDPGYYLIVLRRNAAGDWLIYRDIDTPSPDGLTLRPVH